jgi:hypothetical protein
MAYVFQLLNTKWFLYFTQYLSYGVHKLGFILIRSLTIIINYFETQRKRKCIVAKYELGTIRRLHCVQLRALRCVIMKPVCFSKFHWFESPFWYLPNVLTLSEIFTKMSPVKPESQLKCRIFMACQPLCDILLQSRLSAEWRSDSRQIRHSVCVYMYVYVCVCVCL